MTKTQKRLSTPRMGCGCDFDVTIADSADLGEKAQVQRRQQC